MRPGDSTVLPFWGLPGEDAGLGPRGPEVLRTTRKTLFTTERRKKSQTAPNPQIYQHCQIAGGQGRQPDAFRCLPAATARPRPAAGPPGGCSTSGRPGRSHLPAAGTDSPHSPPGPGCARGRSPPSARVPAQPGTATDLRQQMQEQPEGEPGRPCRHAGPAAPPPLCSDLGRAGPFRTGYPEPAPDVPPRRPEPPTGSAGARRHFWRRRMKWRAAAVAAAAAARGRWR